MIRIIGDYKRYAYLEKNEINNKFNYEKNSHVRDRWYFFMEL